MSGTPNARFAGIAGYFTPGDGYRHAISATAEGRLFETYYGSLGTGLSHFGAFYAISGLAGFYTPDEVAQLCCVFFFQKVVFLRQSSVALRYE